MTPAKMARSATFSLARRDPSFFYLDISTQLLDWETYQAIGGEAARIQNELDDQTRWRSVRTKKSRRFEMNATPPRCASTSHGATEGLQQNVLRRPANAAKELAGFGA